MIGPNLTNSRGTEAHMLEHEFIVVDPVLGDVSCEDRQHAREYAAKVGGTIYRLTWKDGEVIARMQIDGARR